MFENGFAWENFAPAFLVALAGTLKVFAIGLAGFFMVRRGYIAESGLQTLGQLVALLTMPCLIFYRFATQFDPRQVPHWWKYALMGAALTLGGMALGRLISWRHRDNNEAVMLIGFQNAGYFVLPMLQALLTPALYERASLLLFVFVVPFNASMWLAGSTLLLHQRSLDWRTIFTPPFVATLVSLFLYATFHDALHQFDASLPVQVLLGDKTNGAPGALQLIGDLTVPLATLTMGGSIATTLRGPLMALQYKRAALEVTLVKMVIYPLIGFFLLRALLPPAHQSEAIGILWLLLILEFSAPPGMNLPVFARQHNYPMRYIPTACLICYIVCLLTVPFFVALIGQ